MGMFTLIHKNIIVVDKRDELVKSEDILLATIIKNVSGYGYMFSKELLSVLKTFNKEELITFYEGLTEELEKNLGVRDYNPMYVNFPKQVMEVDEVELFLNAIIHYISCGKIMPGYEKEGRCPLLDRTDLKVLTLGTQEDIDTVFKNLLSSKTSISATDKKLVEGYIKEHICDINILPEDIPLKENVCLVINQYMDNLEYRDMVARKYIKTTTDVLRLAVVMSDGDISLKENVRFVNFKRRERVFLMSLFEAVMNEEELVKYSSRYKRLARVLHSSEYTKRFPKTVAAFNKLRAGEKIITFASKVESALKENNKDLAVKLLMSRPGELVRRLDLLLRIPGSNEELFAALESVVDNAETTVVLQAKLHFENRNKESDLRAFFPKGNLANMFAIENNMTPISEDDCISVVNILKESLLRRYSQKGELGRVYIDERLKSYVVPTTQRSASKSLVTVSRGSRFKLEDGKNIIRMFIYWKEPENNRVDIDLSCALCREDWSVVEEISYYDLRSYMGCHSGDITSAPNGASEFIDINIEKALEQNVRYVIMDIYSFSYVKFKNLPECFAGWMLRDKPQSGEVYEPKTVQNKFDISSDSGVVVPVIFDLKNREAIWIDMTYKSNANIPNNQALNMRGMQLLAKAMIEKTFANLYDLFMLHAVSRGELVENKEDADIVFDVEDGIKPTDIDVIVGEYL